MRSIEPGDILLGEQLRKLRKKHKKRQEDVAAQMHVNANKLRRFEQGTQMPTVHELGRWCTATGLARNERQAVEALYHSATSVTMEHPFDFAMLMQRYKSPLIEPYDRRYGWGIALSLQDCPDLQQGWRLSEKEKLLEVEMKRSENGPFEMPETYRGLYQEYFSQHYEEKGFFHDGEKFMLENNPVAFTDQFPLRLRITPCRYSEAMFYWDYVYKKFPQEREALINALIDRPHDGRIPAFPQMFVLHLIVITSDDKILLTQRVPRVIHSPKKWSCSIEEQFARKDLESNSGSSILNLYRRILWEEIGLQEEKEDYHSDNLRVLSVFLESEIVNIALCGYAKLNLDSNTLKDRLKEPPVDLEFERWDFIKLSKEVLLQELLNPSRDHHPTTGYRLLLTFINQFGLPSSSDIASALRSS